MQKINPVTEFENKIAEFFGAPYSVGVDSATNGLELALRLKEASFINVPRRTYVSVAMLANKLGLKLSWSDREWSKGYEIYPGVYDAAPLWEKDGYIQGTMMVISFQFSKHLSIGRAAVILTDKYLEADELRKMAYDGRERDIPWREQDIQIFGYHYYLQPELAQVGLDKLEDAIARPAKVWNCEDYPDISKFKVFQ